MGKAIYYFSGTGNSYKLARDLALELSGTQLIPLARGQGYQLDASYSDVVGIVFPVYAWGPPAAVMRFLEKVRIDPSTYVFAVCTSGGSPGGTLDIVQKELRKRGVTLSSGFSVTMPSNYILWHGAQPEDRQKQIFAAASNRLSEIVSVVSEKRVAPVEKGSPLSRLFLNCAYRLSVGHFAGADKKFTVDGNCNGCGICEKVCPVGNVKLTDGKPVWSHNCEACLACLQWCPEQAIQYGGKTADRARYHHPEVKVSDLMARE